MQALRTNVPGTALSPSSASNLPEPSDHSPVSDTTAITAGTHAATSQYGNCDFVSSRLQPNRKLGSLLKFCFDELEIYYPCIDRADFYGRLSLLFNQHSSNKDGTTLIRKNPEHLALAALTCAVLALATYLGGPASNGTHTDESDCETTAEEWHLESRRLLGEYAWEREPCLDVLRLHILEVLYFTLLEQSRSISMAKAVVVELAFTLELNNEAAWGKTTPHEEEYRRLLWWVVYIVDRQISIRTGRPYLIHDSDVAVGEFTHQSWTCYLSDHILETGSSPTENGFDVHQWPLPSMPSEDWFSYLQFNMCWSKIAARVWDNCCSFGSRRAVDLEELGTLDQLLVDLERSLPPTLLWSPSGLPELVQAGKPDRYLRLRLIIFEVCIPTRVISGHH